MYIILSHLEAEERNVKGGLDIGLKGTEGGTTMYRWAMGKVDEELSYLDVGDGEGLTEEEIANSVDELPQEAP